MKRTLLFAFLSILLVGAIIYRPGEAFQASLQGLTIWWNIVFPGLLPFLSLLELMMAFGGVHFIGTLISPLMQKLFKLPGEAGMAMALGWTAGFPSGAEASAALRRGTVVSRQEGQRLLALSHMPSPLVMLLVVGTGFLNRPEWGLVIAAAVWLAALVAGLVHARAAHEEVKPASGAKDTGSLLRRAASAMADARKADGRTFGRTLGDAVTESVYKLMAIGGFMMICAVIVRLLEPLMPASLPAYVLPGLIESHIGAYAAAVSDQAGGLPWNAALIAAILSFGGISSLFQASSAVSGTDLSLRPLAFMRCIQSALAFAATLVIWKPLTAILQVIPDSITTMEQPGGTAGYPLRQAVHAGDLFSLWPFIPRIMLLFAGLVLVLVLVSVIVPRRWTR
ncbi:nucleoside recognition domain-containing protein [Paenibacillus nasutitermitis]|uniref:Nucleoside transporter/FeoB GTPase Gate domain-containing protein n=1 Tax=Paenibacillus nasutitermitis TaxID=1652958 RepID=A0A916YZT3_9BACL|nr:nucleoside recognition domain-containing protein [Paenibacillus nasutitermitis]GGD68713.1 hypothetical protein GCM10010911_28120 [Paenibacillus nasutitermitis]